MTADDANVRPDSHARKARYAEAMHRATCGHRGGQPGTCPVDGGLAFYRWAEAVMAVADAERDTTTDLDAHIGDQIRFHPQGGSGRRWWTIRALDERYLVCTQQAPFKPAGDLWYTIVDLDNQVTRNGVVPGVARSSLNTLGGGYDIGPDGDGCDRILADLRSGRWELSHRRILQVEAIERRRA